jgi:hypothetical protein
MSSAIRTRSVQESAHYFRIFTELPLKIIPYIMLGSGREIIRLLKEAEVFIAKDMMAVEAARKIGVGEQIYYPWRKEH